MAWFTSKKSQKILELEQRVADLNAKVGVYEEDSNPTAAIFGKLSADYRSTGLSAFFACVNLISNSLATMPINVKFEKRIMGDHPIHEVFYHGRQSKFMFIKQMIWDMLMYGESLAYIRKQNGMPVELIYCEHGSYTVNYTQSKQDLHYLIPFLTKAKVMPDEVIHFMLNSENGYTGKSIRFYAEKVLELAKSTDRSASNYYSSGCAVKGALTIKGSRKNAKESARQAFQQLHSGASGNGLVILDDDMTYQALGGDANSSQMLDSRQFNVIEICRYFNINPVLIGDLSKTSYNQIEQAQLCFITQTLLPYISMIEQELTRKLISKSEHGFTIDLDEKVLLRGDMAATSNYVKTLVSGGIITINEARDMLGLEHIDGADDLIIPFTDIEQNTIGNKNTEDINQDEQ